MNKNIPFHAADILIPRSDHESWAVVACDQFTSEPEYWEKADKLVGKAHSALRIVLPEVYLESDDVDTRIENINKTMDRYLEENIFRLCPDAMIYVERTLSNGDVRRGIVGAVDLREYDYSPTSTSLIRATEGTVLSRIPPRVRIRRGATLELPHVMLLCDDPNMTVIEPLSDFDGEELYDFELMLGGGHLRGVLLDDEQKAKVTAALEALVGDEEHPLLFAVGDGNHSLATAKAASELSGSEKSSYALAELVNLHDSSLKFEPIYRVLFNVDTKDVEEAIKTRFTSPGDKHASWICAGGEGEFELSGLPSKEIQSFIDEYLDSHPKASVDYIHGEDTVRRLAAKEGCFGFLFDGIKKSELFDYVKNNGVLPRKTFSMGDACDKRYYMECRKIK